MQRAGRCRVLAALMALCLVDSAGADFLKILGGLFKADQALFMLGDRGAEKRLGWLLSKFYLMTNKVSRDPSVTGYVNSIFDRLKAAAPRHRYTLRIHVIESPTINAFALPGGTIFIYRGMLDFAESDDEVAAVLGHEIGHVIRRHGMKRMRRDAAAQLLIHRLFEDQQDTELLAQVGALFASMSFSRRNEDESDSVGMGMALAAGYDPSGASSLWERMNARFGSRHGLQGWLSSHPSHESRIKNTRKWLTDHGLAYHRTVGKSFDSASGRLVDLVPNGGFEQPGTGRVPAGWSVLEGEEAWIEDPPTLVLGGTRSLIAEVPRLQSLLLASGPIRASLFKGNRELSAEFHGLSGRPTVYLGVEMLDREGRALDRIFPGGKAQSLAVGTTEILRSPALDPSTFPAGTEKLRVLLYLGRITGGRVLVDDVRLVPGEELDRRLQALLPGGGLEDDGDLDGVPDGYELVQGRRDELEFAEGFASVKLLGTEVDTRSTASLTTPLIPVATGQTYAFGALTRSSEEGLVARIQWLGYDRARRPLAGSPPPAAFTPGPEWRIARDSLTISPPPGSPEVSFVRVRIEVDLPRRQAMWVDDLRIEGAAGGAAGPSGQPLQRLERAPQVVDVSRLPARQAADTAAPEPGDPDDDAGDLEDEGDETDEGDEPTDEQLYGGGARAGDEPRRAPTRGPAVGPRPLGTGAGAGAGDRPSPPSQIRRAPR